MSSFENTNLRFQFLLLIALRFWTGRGDSSRLTEEFNRTITIGTRLPAPSIETRGPSAMGLLSPPELTKKSTFNLINLI